MLTGEIDMLKDAGKNWNAETGTSFVTMTSWICYSTLLLDTTILISTLVLDPLQVWRLRHMLRYVHIVMRRIL